MNEKERIESLRKTIVKKKEKLGLNDSILYLKSLNKFNNLDEIKYPKSVINSYYTYTARDINDRFKDVKYKDYKDSNKYDYVFNRIISEVSKKVFAEVTTIIDGMNEVEAIDAMYAYINKNTNIKNILLSKVEDKIEEEFYKTVVKFKEKLETNKILKLSNSKYKGKYNSYISYDVMVKKISGYTYKKRYGGISVEILNIFSIIATAIVLKAVNEYIFSSEDNFNFIKEKMSKKLDGVDNYFENISNELFIEILEDNNYVVPTFLKATIVLSMEEMLRESFDIYQYEERLKSISGNYAKTYMTKKNIPKNTLDFMKDNSFLNMFGFVEADEECEIEKLNKLSEEFRYLSEKLYLPVVKNHSLRFRKLGKMKALGIYYPGYNTLAVDLDGISSFTHEMFHMIDFENNILSLDIRFKTLLDKYRDLMDEYVDNLGENHETYEFWYKSKSKYTRGYYRSNEEAFARMGEIYVTDILKLDSSFAKVDYTSDIHKVVYPKDEELLKLIKIYYSELFHNLEKNFKRVTFDKNDNQEILKENNTLESQAFFDNTNIEEKVNSFSSKQISFF